MLRLIFRNSQLILLYFCLLNVYLASTEIVNKNVDRNLDISSQLVKETVKILATENAGFSKYSMPMSQKLANNLAFIQFKDKSGNTLKYNRKDENDLVNFNVNFPKTDVNQELNVEMVFTQLVKPFPEEIRQSEKQFVKYNGYFYYFSHYPTTKQRTSVTLGSSNVISYNQTKPFNLASKKLSYGPYENVKALSDDEMYLHFENENPFMTVDRLERVIQVSHWGNIAVEDSISLTHTGAKLKGSFSRYEFQKDGRSGQSSIKSYHTILPASAFGAYYRDMNGNISTSNIRQMREYVDIELRPRFPLFGGWKTQYILGYNIPSFEYLFNEGNDYSLKMRLIDHIYDDMVIKEASIKIILPEGATNIKLKTPYTVNNQENSVTYTYLDTFGRPTLSVRKDNMVENHISNFELNYNFSKVMLLQEPLLLIGFVFIIFLLTIIYTRLDFSISSHSHKD